MLPCPYMMFRGYVVVRLIPSTRGSVIVGLDEAVRRMSLGETSMILVRYDYAYGNFCVGAHIPPRANLIFKVQLLEINNLGRLQIPIRMMIRFRRFCRRFMQRCRNQIAYHRTEHPWHHAFIRFLRYIGILEPEPEVDDDALMNKQYLDEDDYQDGDDDSDDLNDTKKRYYDPRMKGIVTKGAVAGAVYQWGYKPHPKRDHAKLTASKDRFVCSNRIRYCDTDPGSLIRTAASLPFRPLAHDICEEDESEYDNHDEESDDESLTSLEIKTQERNVQMSRTQVNTTVSPRTSNIHVPQWMSGFASPGGRTTHLRSPAAAMLEENDPVDK
jgi:hypothetical protein